MLIWSVFVLLICLVSVRCDNKLRIVWFMEKARVDLTTVGCPTEGTIRDSMTGDIVPMKFIASPSDAKLLVCVLNDINLFVFRIIIMKNKLALKTEAKTTYKEGDRIKVDCSVSLYIMDVYNLTILSLDFLKDGKTIKSIDAFTKPNTEVALRIDQTVLLESPRVVKYQDIILDSKVKMECVLSIDEFNYNQGVDQNDVLGREIYRKFSVMKDSVTLRQVHFPLRKVGIGKTQAKRGETLTCQAEVFPPLYDCLCVLNGEDLQDNNTRFYEEPQWKSENNEDIIELQLKNLERKQFKIGKEGTHTIKCLATSSNSNITWSGEVDINEDGSSMNIQESCVCPSKASVITKSWLLICMVFWSYV